MSIANVYYTGNIITATNVAHIGRSPQPAQKEVISQAKKDVHSQSASPEMVPFKPSSSQSPMKEVHQLAASIDNIGHHTMQDSQANQND